MVDWSTLWEVAEREENGNEDRNQKDEAQRAEGERKFRLWHAENVGTEIFGRRLSRGVDWNVKIIKSHEMDGN